MGCRGLRPYFPDGETETQGGQYWQKSLRVGQSHTWNTKCEPMQATLPDHLSATISLSPALGREKKQNTKVFWQMLTASVILPPEVPTLQLCNKQGLSDQTYLTVPHPEGLGCRHSLNALPLPSYPRPSLSFSRHVSWSHHKPEVKWRCVLI